MKGRKLPSKRARVATPDKTRRDVVEGDSEDLRLEQRGKGGVEEIQESIISKGGVGDQGLFAGAGLALVGGWRIVSTSFYQLRGFFYIFHFFLYLT